MELFTIPFIRNVFIAAALVAMGLAPLSIYVVLRRIVFVGAAVAEVSSAGVALAVLFNVEPFPVAMVLTVATFLVLARAAESERLPVEALIGILYAGGSAAAVLLIVKAPRGEAGILNVLFGNILTVPEPLLIGLAAAVAGVLALLYFAHKEFLFSAYDPDTARAVGIRVTFWNTLFYVAAGIAVAVAIRAVGALVAFALLVAPGAAALSVAQSLKGAFTFATVLGVTSSIAGVACSYWFDTPTGPTIVALLAVAFSLSYLCAAATRR
jgi:zinc transport system permease protein